MQYNFTILTLRDNYVYVWRGFIGAGRRGGVQSRNFRGGGAELPTNHKSLHATESIQ